MYVLLMVVHLLVCIGLIGVVLIQSGKGGGLAGGAFGGSAQTVFGGRGATDFITRATMVLGAAFFITSLALALLSAGAARPTRSLIQEEARRTGGGPPVTAPPSGTPAGAPGVGSPATGPAAPALPGPPTPGGVTPGGASGAAPGGRTAPPPAKPPGGN